MACQTCDIIRGLLMAKGVPSPLVDLAIESVARDEEVMKAQARLLGKKVKKRIRSSKQRINDRLKSAAWKKANSIARKINGDFKKGWNQKRVAQYANKILRKS